MGALRQRLKSLATIESTYPHILSVYLKLRDGGKECLKEARIFLKNRAADIENVLASDSKARANLTKEIAAVERFLNQEAPDSTGVALFLKDGEIFERFDTAVAMENHLAYRRVPHIAPLAHVEESLEPFLIVSIDSRSAKIFDVAMGSGEARDEINNEVHRRIQAGGWSQMRYQRHIDNQKREHLEEVAEHLGTLVRELSIKKIVLIGPDKTTARFLETVSADLKKKIVERARMDSHASEKEIIDNSLQYILKAEDAEEEERIRRARIEIHSSRMAVAGIDNVLRYLNSGQAYQLMLAHDFNESGMECSSCGAIAHHKSESLTVCPSCDANSDSLKTVELRELMTRRALNYGIDLHFMKSPAFRETLGNAAALLHSPH